MNGNNLLINKEPPGFGIIESTIWAGSCQCNCVEEANYNNQDAGDEEGNQKVPPHPEVLDQRHIPIIADDQAMDGWNGMISMTFLAGF